MSPPNALVRPHLHLDVDTGTERVSTATCHFGTMYTFTASAARTVSASKGARSNGKEYARSRQNLNCETRDL